MKAFVRVLWRQPVWSAGQPLSDLSAPSQHMAWPLMASAEEVVEWGSLCDDSTCTSSCLELEGAQPTAAVPWCSSLSPPPPSLVAWGFLWVSCLMLFWGVGLWAGLKELVKTTTKMLIPYILCSRLCTSNVTLDLSRPQSLTKIHCEGIAMVWVFAPTTKFKYRVPNPKRWWY